MEASFPEGLLQPFRLTGYGGDLSRGDAPGCGITGFPEANPVDILIP